MVQVRCFCVFFFSSRRRHTRLQGDWSSDVCSSDLQGAQGPGRSHLETSFPLRCFQRLSLPHLATRQCHWRDNRYTRGVSTPVDRKSTRLNSSHLVISYAVFCLKKKKMNIIVDRLL